MQLSTSPPRQPAPWPASLPAWLVPVQPYRPCLEMSSPASLASRPLRVPILPSVCQGGLPLGPPSPELLFRSEACSLRRGPGRRLPAAWLLPQQPPADAAEWPLLLELRVQVIVTGCCTLEEAKQSERTQGRGCYPFGHNPLTDGDPAVTVGHALRLPALSSHTC